MTLRFIDFKQANRNISKGRSARAAQALAPHVAQSFFKLAEYIIRCSTFNVRCSLVFLKLDWPLFRPAATLTPEHCR